MHLLFQRDQCNKHWVVSQKFFHFRNKGLKASSSSLFTATRMIISSNKATSLESASSTASFAQSKLSNTGQFKMWHEFDLAQWHLYVL